MRIFRATVRSQFDGLEAQQALAQAAERLDRMAVPYKRLRVDLMDMASIWQD